MNRDWTGKIPVFLVKISWKKECSHNLNTSLEKVTEMRSEIMLMFWVCSFCKRAGWHPTNSLRINVFTYNFQGFWLNELFPMGTSRPYPKLLKSTCEIVCLLCMPAKIQQLVHETSSLPEVFYKTLFWKSSQNSVVNIRSIYPEVFCQKGVFNNLAKSTGKHLQ